MGGTIDSRGVIALLLLFLRCVVVAFKTRPHTREVDNMRVTAVDSLVVGVGVGVGVGVRPFYRRRENLGRGLCACSTERRYRRWFGCKHSRQG